MPNRMKDLWLWALKDPPPHPSCSGCRWVKPQNPVPSAHRSIGHRTDQRVRNRGNCCRWIASTVGWSGADVVGTSGFYGRCALELCPLGFSWGIWAWMPLAVDLYSFPLKIYLFAGGTEAVGWSGALYQGIYSLVCREKKNSIQIGYSFTIHFHFYWAIFSGSGHCFWPTNLAPSPSLWGLLRQKRTERVSLSGEQQCCQPAKVMALWRSLSLEIYIRYIKKYSTIFLWLIEVGFAIVTHHHRHDLLQFCCEVAETASREL